MALASSLRTGNPTLNEHAFDVTGGPSATRSDAVMTVNGVVNRTGILLLITFAASTYTWGMISQAVATGSELGFAGFMPWVYGPAIGGLIMALVTVFKKEWAFITAPLYCVLEGLFLGAVSGIFEFLYPGIVIQAVGLTFGTLGALLLAYRAGLIKATPKLKRGIIIATGAIALLYVGELVANLAFGARMPYIHESGLIGIGFSLVVIVVAALNLVLDFDFIERGAEQRAPKHLEWYAAFGLMVTLIWLYLEFLQLLSKLRR